MFYNSAGPIVGQSQNLVELIVIANNSMAAIISICAFVQVSKILQNTGSSTTMTPTKESLRLYGLGDSMAFI